jgi:redox-sensitive bicupin YhaK (pirin superfamily)
MKFRSIRSIVQMTQSKMGAGFTTHGVRDQLGVPLDPFINLDNFHMTVPTFRAHPHAGFSAVTYMFEDSEGSFLNRDSMGDASRIAPGDLHWTQAAGGVLHEEVPEVPGQDCHGLQMFVSLTEENELKPARCFHLNSADVPEVQPADGVRIRVLCGESHGAVSPLQDLLTPITLLDVHLAPNSSVTHQLPGEHFAMAMMIKGEVNSDSSAECKLIGCDHVVAFDHDGDAVKFTAGSSAAQFLLAAGKKVNRPNFWAGPFCMGRQERANDAMARYKSGAMGQLTSSF